MLYSDKYFIDCKLVNLKSRCVLKYKSHAIINACRLIWVYIVETIEVTD